MEGGTTFHFLDATPAKALQVALEAALGQDVRIGGGPTVAREFIAAGLVDQFTLTGSAEAISRRAAATAGPATHRRSGGTPQPAHRRPPGGRS